MNPGCFYIGFVLPFTRMNMNPVRNDHRESLNLELSNPETFAGTSYPKKYESGEKTLV